MRSRPTLFLALAFFAFSTGAAAEDPYRSFFAEYESLSNHFDAKVADLYSDDANMIAVRILPDGTEQKLSLDGKKFKGMFAELADIAKTRGDTNKYSNIQINRDGESMKISASRYSGAKCYTDNDYYMKLRQRADGRIEIIEEFSTSPSKSACANASENDLDLVLEATVKLSNKQLPVMVDSDTRLEKLSTDGKTMTYHYLLVNYAARDLDATALMKLLVPTVIRQTCDQASLKAILEQGGSIAHRYNAKDNVLIGEVAVNKKSCEP